MPRVRRTVGRAMNSATSHAIEVQFEGMERKRESAPCTYNEKDGTARKGTIYYTLETAKVRFRAPVGVVRAGHQGQMSSIGDHLKTIKLALHAAIRITKRRNG